MDDRIAAFRRLLAFLLCLHNGACEVLVDEKSSAQVDGDDLVEKARIDFVLDLPQRVDTGAMSQPVDPSELGDACCDESLDLGLVRDLDADKANANANRRYAPLLSRGADVGHDLVSRLRGRHVAKDELAAARGELERDATADPAGSSCADASSEFGFVLYGDIALCNVCMRSWIVWVVSRGSRGV
jgi:hypothetical protein